MKPIYRLVAKQTFLTAAYLGVACVFLVRSAVAASFVLLGLDTTNQISYINHHDAASGAFLGSVAIGTNLSYCSAMTYAPNGNLFIAEYSTHRIHRFDYHSGAYLGVFTTVASLAPLGLEFGPDGNLYVGVAGGGIQRFNGVTGGFLGTFVPGLGAPGTDFGGMTFHGAYLFVTYLGSNGTLYQYNAATGVLITNLYSGFSGNGPRTPAFGPDGFLYVPDWQTTHAVKFSGTTYSFISNYVTGGGTSPISLAFDTSTTMLELNDGTVPVNVRRYDLSTAAFLTTVVPPGGAYNRGVAIRMVPDPVTGPRVAATAVGPAQAGITWHTVFSGFIPEFTTNVAAPIWQPVTNIVTSVGDGYSFIVNARVPRQFFRLRKP